MANKSFRTVLGLLALLAAFTLLAFSQTPDQKPRNTCRGAGCGAMSRAELFLKTFYSSGNSKGLRTSEIQAQNLVINAFFGIDATMREVEAGRLSKKQGDEDIETYIKHIRGYIDSQSKDAMVIAVGGQVSDLLAMNKPLGGLLSVARQDAFIGREEVALKAQQYAIEVLTTFSQKFAETCEQQSFPVEIALELQRQNELMGTGVSVTHCANRKYTADFNDLGLKYHLETCSGISLPVWNETISGHVGEGSEGGDVHWEEKIVYDETLEAAGTMKITVKEIEEKEETVKVPNDAGPNAKPNGWASAPIPDTPARHYKRMLFMKIRKLPLSSFGKDGVRVEMLGNEPWMEAEIKSENKPCSPVTEP